MALLPMKIRGNCRGLFVPDLHCQQDDDQRERDHVGKEDGQRIEPEPVGRPEQHSQTKERQHRKRDVVGRFCLPAPDHLREKRYGGEGAGKKTDERDRLDVASRGEWDSVSKIQKDAAREAEGPRAILEGFNDGGIW